MRRRIVFGLAAAVILLAACSTARHPAIPMVRAHAAHDLDCPDKKIFVEPEWGGRYRATGCGRTAVYHSACEQLQCTVGQEEDEAPAWRGRPEPGSIEESR